MKRVDVLICMTWPKRKKRHRGDVGGAGPGLPNLANLNTVRSNPFALTPIKRKQKHAVDEVMPAFRPPPPDARVHVTLIRVAYRARMDDDGIVSSLKFVRDRVAAWMGRNDRQGPLLQWSYFEQATSIKGYQGARIVVFW